MSHYLPVRPDWLASYTETAIDPDVAIVDSHHHVWDIPEWRYMFEDVLADMRAGHRVIASVFVQCYSMYRKDGPKELRCIGETEFANGVAAMSASGVYGDTRICDGIVGMANLTAGAEVERVLEAHVRAAGERFKGIRQITAYDDEPAIHNKKWGLAAGIAGDAGFRAGYRRLGRMGLSFDAYVFHTQLGELAGLARAEPETTLVLNHVGAPVGIGRFAGQREAVAKAWRAGIAELAACPNVFVKLGGMGMATVGFDFHQQAQPPSSDMLSAAWAPYMDYCIEKFGPGRCMFESNFPVDKGSCSYVVLWNAFKKIARRYTAAEQFQLFAGTAGAVYRLPSVAALSTTRVVAT
ncbi:MAG TPA: amidohydrolase family protein [Ramlibacter sp.]|uniref:amidohydrolase family protein n=1 Tax=Ramlibacter sp. TaxID=1917967 RepID=UPI002BC35FED|nr:amidohydrolase family protein [Ramlibacter sp.]HVZ45778.1 amidohydrolase family protein [Ramlibacter sp.]